jgi:hypothetical protein
MQDKIIEDVIAYLYISIIEYCSLFQGFEIIQDSESEIYIRYLMESTTRGTYWNSGGWS